MIDVAVGPVLGLLRRLLLFFNCCLGRLSLADILPSEGPKGEERERREQIPMIYINMPEINKSRSHALNQLTQRESERGRQKDR